MSAPAGAGLLTIVHGLPALPGAMPANNPVDIAVDFDCKYTYEPYGAKLGPMEMADGEHSIIFYESVPNKPCSGTVLAALNGPLIGDFEFDLVLGLNAQDSVAISLWDNKPSLAAVNDGNKTAVEVRHSGAGPTLTAVLNKGNTTVQTGDIPAGSKLGPIGSTEGDHALQIKKGAEVLDIVNGSFKPGRVYWSYVTGSVFKKTTNLLVIESLPDELSEEETPGTPKFSTCCLYGVASQLSVANCQTSNGVYIGDVNPVPNPCKF